jgi:peptidoglycan/LPS O-acetylase OafA/YrhL
MKRGDIPVLHGIRGCLAVWVMLGHTLDACGAYIPVLSAPGVAVYAFMVMSGFLMALHFRLREDREPWANYRTWLMFYVRRLFRIAPLYYLVLIIAFTFHNAYMAHYYALQALFPLWFIHPPLAIPNFGFSSLLLHATFLFGFIPSQSDNNILPDWSIGLEMQFYLLFPFMMLALRRIGAFWFALTSLAIVFLTQTHVPAFPQPSFLAFVLTTFVVGIFMSEAWLHDDRLKSAMLLVLAIFLASIRLPFMFQAIPLAMIFLINFPQLFAELKLTTLGGISTRLLGGRIGLFIGDRSYSVYLIHMLILVPLVSFLATMPRFAHAAPTSRFMFTAPLMIFLCYAFSSITLVLIENPFIEYGRKAVNHWRSHGGRSRPPP